eukprot:CAMPEP_0118924608 /NCGR_PEP_ID=MMETSP1169-20130426/2666_1 /TAXON_ID=36882 /ORGANISM="Pyramimonas obovata, Strain CCMP722" /LENGTH=210 /DNA_ID=CAMNT_0006865735 /DNA_START=349 /DNA_END=983 /DNA_ORIENTATION=+
MPLAQLPAVVQAVVTAPLHKGRYAGQVQRGAPEGMLCGPLPAHPGAHSAYQQRVVLPLAEHLGDGVVGALAVRAPRAACLRIIVRGEEDIEVPQALQPLTARKKPSVLVGRGRSLAENTPVERYRSPRSQMMHTITAFSTCAERRSAAEMAPPLDTPQNIPSTLAAARIASSASSCVISMTVSTRDESKIFGRYSSDHRRMPAMLAPSAG